MIEAIVEAHGGVGAVQDNRTARLAGAATGVVVLALLAALITWSYVRGTADSPSNPLAIGVVFAAVLTAGAVGLLVLAGRDAPAVPHQRDAEGAGGARTDGGPGATEVTATGESTHAQLVRPPRTALDPLGRRYGRHARPEPVGDDEAARPAVSELQHPMPDDLATTLHDQLFTHRSGAFGPQ